LLYLRYFGENNSKIEDTNTKTGLNNFKKASQKFTNTHKTASILYLNRSKLSDSCASQLNSQHKKTVEINRNFQKKIEERNGLIKFIEIDFFYAFAFC
jgi:hypothetical protein